jgi:Tfp pilus assembly protein PilX
MAKSTRFYNRKTSTHGRGRRPFLRVRNDRGIALLISLMLLTLMSVMSLIMVLTVSPDMLINGYYGNFRGSFYAADSGLNMARQQLVNQISSSTYVSHDCLSRRRGAPAPKSVLAPRRR